MTNAKGRCINPAEIAANDLVAYAMGEGTTGVTEHISRCSFCQDRAGEYAGPVQLLSRTLFRRSCLPSTTISHYALGMLSGRELIDAASHLSECPHCMQEKEALSRFLAETEDPAPATGIIESLRRLIATPLTPPMMGMAALRGNGVAETTTYVADESRVTLSAQSSSSARSKKVIVGLVESRAGFPDGARVDLLREGRVLATENVDDAGNFFFEGVTPGTYTLLVRLDEEAVEIPAFEVDPQA